MPHVIVKLWPGKTDEEKHRLTDAIVNNVIGILNNSKESVSVAFEEIPSGDWKAKVYEPDIVKKWANLTKEPGYGPGPGR